MGEPSGIGGEIAVKAWRQRGDLDLPPFFLIDDPGRLKVLADSLGLKLPIETIDDPSQCIVAFDRALPVLPLRAEVRADPGKPSGANAGAVLDSIREAVALALAGAVSAVVTNPIHKQVLMEAGFDHPGHTEFLAELCGSQRPPVMMLACAALRVVPVTVHQPLSHVPNTLTAELIEQTGRTTVEALKSHFGIRNPKLAVAGLNPHAGEGGQLGHEEARVIQPAVDALRAEGVELFGPLPADSLFHPAARRGYDAALCMYHDQALIPIKTIDFERGVNVTLGLPIVRTSPDHGTALDIAGQGKASPVSLVAAIQMAAEMTQAASSATHE